MQFVVSEMKSTSLPYLGMKESLPGNNLSTNSDNEVPTTSQMFRMKVASALTTAPPVPLTLSQFATTFSNSLPQTVRLEGGYSDVIADTVLRNGDILNVVQLKNVSVAAIQENGGHSTVMTSLSSNVRISIIYAPDNNLNRAMEGTTFKTVRQLLQAKILPKAVGVLEAWKNDDTFIDLSDVLILRWKVRRVRKAGLLVFSTKYKMDVFLPESCNALFSTAPDMVTLPLSEITSLIPDLLPLTVYHSGTSKCLLLTSVEVRPVFVAELVDRQPSVIFELPVGNPSPRFIVQRQQQQQADARDAATVKEVRGGWGGGLGRRAGEGRQVYGGGVTVGQCRIQLTIKTGRGGGGGGGRSRSEMCLNNPACSIVDFSSN